MQNGDDRARKKGVVASKLRFNLTFVLLTLIRLFVGPARSISGMFSPTLTLTSYSQSG